VELDWTLPGPRLADSQVILGVIHDDELYGTILWMRHPTVSVERPEVRGYLALFLETNVIEFLVSQYYASAFCSKQGQLVEASRREL
jgi:hypothetical protein